MKASPLLFDWPHRHRIQFLLPAGILVATLAHAGILVLIGIIHPSPRFDGPNPARVYFLSPENTSHPHIQGLLLSSDPALYAPKQGLPLSDITTTATYTPQFEAATPSLIALSSRPKPETPLPALPAKLDPIKHPRPPTPSRARAENIIHLTGTLANRATDTLRQPLDLPDTLQGTPSFLVGVSPAGEVLHITPNRSTGDPAADTRLLHSIRSLRFSATESPGTTWGIVEIRPGAAP